MPTLEDDELVFRFPDIDEGAYLAIRFRRTLRIPDSDKTFPLPPGFGSFPLRHAEDYASRLPSTTTGRGGVILPMWKAEAMWLSFRNSHYHQEFPFAVKIAAGKINAVTGEAWRPGLYRNPQDYMVSPDQPWLDGFAVQKSVTRQVVAMPLGAGYTVEEQLTSEAEWGGIQISVVPLKAHIWRAWCAKRNEPAMVCRSAVEPPVVEMGLAAGGRVRQEIYSDPFNLSDWDQTSAQRVFVTLVHARDWEKITGEAAPNEPPTAKAYSAAGLPWYEFYGEDREALPGGKRLGSVKSLAEMFVGSTGVKFLSSRGVEMISSHVAPSAADRPRAVRTCGSCGQYRRIFHEQLELRSDLCAFESAQSILRQITLGASPLALDEIRALTFEDVGDRFCDTGFFAGLRLLMDRQMIGKAVRDDLALNIESLWWVDPVQPDLSMFLDLRAKQIAASILRRLPADGTLIPSQIVREWVLKDTEPHLLWVGESEFMSVVNELGDNSMIKSRNQDGYYRLRSSPMIDSEGVDSRDPRRGPFRPAHRAPMIDQAQFDPLWLQKTLEFAILHGWCIDINCTTCDSRDLRVALGLLELRSTVGSPKYLAMTEEKALTIVEGLALCKPFPRGGGAVMWVLYEVWRRHGSTFDERLHGTWAGEVLRSMQEHSARRAEAYARRTQGPQS